MSDLFESAISSETQPLAARMRPRSIEEFTGQEHIVGPGRLLRRAIDADQISSIIFYGPPGTGKTTLARVIANTTKSHFSSLNAVLSGVSDLRKAIDQAREERAMQGKKTILFIDEVHRWNKSQQDALLPWVENGTVVLIGATTENPYFEVNKALVSRSRVFQMVKLDESHLTAIAQAALSDKERGYGRWQVFFEAGALEHLVNVSAGDARSLLNAIQLAVETAPENFPPPDGSKIVVSAKAAEESIQRKAVLYDKEGDYHFDTISAFIKSLRGSDPDAALYWMALMIRAGEDPRYIFRRMLILACEDVGLASPDAIGVVESCAAAYDRVGLPEGQFFLTQACLFLATAAKSNSALGYFDALRAINEEANQDIPKHIKDSSRDKKSFGHGQGYKYPHAWREHWTLQQYLPDNLSGRVFYQPGELGYEGSIRETVMKRRESQVAFILHDAPDTGEILTFSPGDDERERWVRRTEKNQEALNLRIREKLFERWEPLRHHRVFIPADSGGVLLWEAHRMVPEGAVTALCRKKAACDALGWLAEGLPVTERPRIILENTNTMEQLSQEKVRYDVLLARNWFNRYPQAQHSAVLQMASNIMEKPCRLHVCENNLSKSTSLANLLPNGSLINHEAEFRQAEKDFFSQLQSATAPAVLEDLFERSGWNEYKIEECQISDQRRLSSKLFDQWFAVEREGSYGYEIAKILGQDAWQQVSTSIKALLDGKNVTWKSHFVIISAYR